jgi:hypothetical protein
VKQLIGNYRNNVKRACVTVLHGIRQCLFPSFDCTLHPSRERNALGTRFELLPSGWCYTLKIVPQFVIEREIPGAGALSNAKIREVSLRSLKTLKEMGPQIQWLHSYVTEDKVYCVYLAPDQDTIREHARRTGIPANRVAAVRRLIGPSNLS